MYKTKLQELCQKRAWQLPEYDVVKQGLDHNPRFEATVTVNGIPFQSQAATRSSKQAQNDAAHLAFLHFTSPPPPPAAASSSPSPSPPLPTPGSSNAIADSDNGVANRVSSQLEIQEANQNSQVKEPAYICEDNDKFKDIQHLYKNLLQNFAQKRNLSLPVYSCEFEGPPHACRFKCKVTINEQTYECLEYFPTIKEAEHAAAKIALSSLSPYSFQEEDFTVYKNLLQELTQKEGCPLPIYTTTRSGEAHASTFVSTVEVKGEVFTGQRAKTKKQAEVLAAKVAYMKLKDCKSNRGSAITTPVSQEQEVPMPSSSHSPSNANADDQQNVNLKARTTFNPSSTSSKDQHEDKAMFLTKFSCESIPVDGTFSNFPQPEMTPDLQSSPSSSNLSDLPEPEKTLSSSSLPSDHSVTTNLVPGSVTKRPIPVSNLSCNRVVVRPRVANMELPRGSTVLPFSDDDWVAYKLGSQPDQ